MSARFTNPARVAPGFLVIDLEAGQVIEQVDPNALLLDPRRKPKPFSPRRYGADVIVTMSDRLPTDGSWLWCAKPHTTTANWRPEPAVPNSHQRPTTFIVMAKPSDPWAWYPNVEPLNVEATFGPGSVLTKGVWVPDAWEWARGLGPDGTPQWSVTDSGGHGGRGGRRTAKAVVVARRIPT